MHTYTNELIHETSPYLLQHAHNPVNWHAWSESNLKEAKKMNKPLLISIGYSSCHWCHVMEKESFEDEEIATYMNTHFYCIKVDREERPDVDQVYMTGANIITGQGGWPLNCFALPDGKPFHAGTYYPSKGWLKLLKNITKQYTDNFSKIKSYAQKLTVGIQMQETAISDQTPQKLTADVLENMINTWKSKWDYEYGGMKGAPKFPMPSNYDFLLAYSSIISNSSIQDFIDISLQKMAFGGLFDQIGGGFSRYSVDAVWKVPHFEKMLYDNAQLLAIYARAFRKTNNPLYAQVIKKTIDWLQREMQDNSGLFYAGIDADSEGKEGKYYVWNSDEVKQNIGSDYPLVKAYYEIDQQGQWEHPNNILLRTKTDAIIASEFDLTPSELNQRIDAVNKKLLQVRNQRVAPGLDDKCLTSWNAMMVTGLLEAYTATHDETCKNLAIHALNQIIEKQYQHEQLWHSYKNNQSSISGMLEDYAFVIQACLNAFSITGQEKYLDIANQLTTISLHRFYDVEKAFFYFNEENELIIRTAEIHDNVIPSSNAVMANNLLKLGLILGNQSYLELAENLVGKVQANMGTYPSGHCYWAQTHLALSYPFYEVVIVGKNAQRLALQMQSIFLPNTLILWTATSSNISIFKNRFKSNETWIYVCQRGVCKLPVKTVEEAMELIQ